jgi:long-chain fatty acid transport protein
MQAEHRLPWWRWTGGALALWLGQAMATNGYIQHGIGQEHKAMGGAGVALPLSPMSAATNPALLTSLDSGVEVGMSMFSPRRRYEVSGMAPGAFPLLPGGQKSRSEYFPIPDMGWTQKLDDHNAVGIAIYANGGMNTNYSPYDNPMCPPGSPQSGTFCFGQAGIDYKLAVASFGYAHSLDNGLSLGISPLVAWQSFKARGLGAFGGFSAEPDRLTNQGNDSSWGLGIKLGATWQHDWLTLGAAWQSRINMAHFQEYRGLFADHGDFDVPPQLTLGLAVHPTPQHTFALDFQRNWFHEVDPIGNDFARLSQGGLLGAANGAGFGWKNTNAWKLGYALQATDDMVLRLGYNRGQNPVESSEVLFNLLAPGVMRDHITAGVGYRLTPRQDINVTAMYAPNEHVGGQNPMAPGQRIDLKMEQFEIGLGWALRF